MTTTRHPPLKALTVWQPWASLIVLGEKQYETRSWRTSYRGVILIHAGARTNPILEAMAASEPFKTSLRGSPVTRGALIGAATLTAIRPTDGLDVSPAERAFGDFRHGRWAWLLEHPVRFETPIPHPGARGIFYVDHEALGAAHDALRRAGRVRV